MGLIPIGFKTELLDTQHHESQLVTPREMRVFKTGHVDGKTISRLELCLTVFWILLVKMLERGVNDRLNRIHVVLGNRINDAST